MTCPQRGNLTICPPRGRRHAPSGISAKERKMKMTMISFRKIDSSNFHDVIKMEVNENQKGFMEDNLYSLAECSFEKDFLAKAVYSGGEPVGFILYYFVKDEPDYVFLHRFMIDRKKQGKGLGRAALNACMELFKKEFPSAECVELMHYPDNLTGGKLYESLGFLPTGELRKSEPCRCEAGSDDPDRYVEIVRRKFYDAE